MQNNHKETPASGPLSFSEEGAWNEFVTDPALFFKRGAVLSADLPPGAGLDHVRDILANISARHEVFRTAFCPVAGQATRQVLPGWQHKIMEADDEVYPMMGESTTSLSPDDLARVWLTPGKDGAKRLLIDINELITDSWSCARLHPELELLAASWGSAAPSLPAPEGYSEFARSQRDQELPGRVAEYWRQQLDGMAAPGYLEADGPDPSGDIAGERVVIFTDEMTAGLRAICQQRRLSPFMVAVALVQMVLAARSGARDIALSTMTGTRPSRWTEVQGNFSNTIVLRTVLPPNPSFADALALSRASVLGALKHHSMPFLQLGEVLGTPVVPPPVRVQFLPHRAHHYRILDSRPSGDAWIEDAVFAGFPMDIGFAEDRHGRVAIWMSYDPKLFSHALAGELLDGCCQALPRVAANPDLTCDDLRQRVTSG